MQRILIVKFVLKKFSLTLLCTCVILLSACGGGSGSTPTGIIPPTMPLTLEPSLWPAGALPVGDGLLALSPTQGELMSCVTSWPGAAYHPAPWIHGYFWYPAQKVSVQGSVNWPTASTQVNTSGDTTTITSNNLPDEPSGVFPIQSTDPAYNYNQDSDYIVSENINITLPASPKAGSAPTCVPSGMIGFALNGVAIYNALDDEGRDANVHDMLDSCDAHPYSDGQYHYHGPSPCMPNVNTSDQVGYALDGYGIYGEKDLTTGDTLHDTDLDACHGTLSPVMWNGNKVTIYHYVLTEEFPYTIGCFTGTPVTADLSATQIGEIKNFP